MDAVRAGRVFRALRRHLGLRQADVASRAGVSQQHVSDLERGRADEMAVGDVGRLFAALGARAEIQVTWRGGQLDRLLDEEHARTVGAIAGLLRGLGWQVLPEVTFSVYGERGSIDLLAWHAETGTLLVVEVKTEVASAEELLRRHDAKVRLARGLGQDRFGVRATTVGRLLVVTDSATNRRRVQRLEPVLGSVYPVRGVALRRWLRSPRGTVGGLLFAGTARGGASRRPAGPARVRRRSGTAPGGK